MSKLDDLIDKIGHEKSCDILAYHLERQSDDVLTIVANKGVHHLPSECLRGEVYYASEGTLDFSSIEFVKVQYEKILGDVSVILKKRPWKHVYLVPFGHSTLCMQIKLLVFRVTRIETTDLFYDGKGHYSDLCIEQRNLIVSSEDNDAI